MSEVVKWPGSAGTRGVPLSEQPQRDPNQERKTSAAVCARVAPKRRAKARGHIFAWFAQSPGAGRPGV